MSLIYYHLNVFNSVDFKLNVKQIHVTLPRWVAMVECIDIETCQKTKSIIDYFIAENPFLELIVENEQLIPVKDVCVCASDRDYHHLLPGVAVELRLTNNYKLRKINNFHLFSDCIKQIELMQPPSVAVFATKFPFTNEIIHLNTMPMYAPQTSTPAAEAENFPQTKYLLLPAMAVSFLIGKGGKNIHCIRQKTSAKIKIMKPPDKGISSMSVEKNSPSEFLQRIAISGHPNEISKVEQLLVDRLAKWVWK